MYSVILLVRTNTGQLLVTAISAGNFSWLCKSVAICQSLAVDSIPWCWLDVAAFLSRDLRKAVNFNLLWTWWSCLLAISMLGHDAKYIFCLSDLPCMRTTHVPSLLASDTSCRRALMSSPMYTGLGSTPYTDLRSQTCCTPSARFHSRSTFNFSLFPNVASFPAFAWPPFFFLLMYFLLY